MHNSNKSALLAEVVAYETRVWDALVSGDKAADAGHLSDRFLGVYSDGFAGKADHAGQLDNGPTVLSYTLADHKIMAFGENHALLSYRATFRRVGQDRSEMMYVSSVWERMPDGWINVFSQDTPAQEQATPP
ncbi:MAG: DUF4440 domain-containing protein [Sulfitobacter sp.]